MSQSSKKKNSFLPSVVVLGGSTTSLAIVRCLAKAAIRSTVICFREKSICSYSRFCDTLLPPLHPEQDEQLVTWLTQEFSRAESKPFLLPSSDLNALFIAKNSEQLSKTFLIWGNSHDDLMNLVNKKRLHRLAIEAGLSPPPGLTSPKMDELAEWLDKNVGPYFVKPFYTSDPRSPITEKNEVFSDRAELLDFVSEYGTDSLIIQRQLVGGDGNIFDCYGLCNSDGTVVCSATHRRIRQSRGGRGITSYGEIPATNAPFPPDELIVLTNTLFSAMKFHGIFGVEWLWDESAESLFLIDVNARPFSSIGHLADSGLNLPALAVEEIAGRPLTNSLHRTLSHSYWLDFSRDVYSALAHFEAGELTFIEWIRDIFRARSYSYWNPRDLLPFLVANIRLCTWIIKGLCRRVKGGSRK